eukprot:Unigene15218_Nuclearia_a/m.45521 Unigene15218_Nuclearia_a/g.45521  ORF Unigene15218_Nuclearia_a/g.45521 Unigene15218_Nuclearia_a/m.45521 type:complete len:174 (-) Unigene15218_Nuclearia_a:78-599(-)
MAPDDGDSRHEDDAFRIPEAAPGPEDAAVAAVAGARSDLALLPNELFVRLIALYMGPGDVARAMRVCRRWRVLLRNSLVWWRFTMRMVWEESARPLRMSASDRKIDWHKRYLSIAEAKKTPGPSEPAPEPQLNKPWVDHAAPSKADMRAYYKSIRSKPRGKRPEHVPREFADV